MTDQELFDVKRITARQAVVAAELARTPPPEPDLFSPEYVAVTATKVHWGVGGFDGTYPHPGSRKVAGYIAPAPPGGLG